MGWLVLWVAGVVKKAAAQTNAQLGLLPQDIADLVVKVSISDTGNSPSSHRPFSIGLFWSG